MNRAGPIWVTISSYRLISDFNIGSNLYLCAFGYVWRQVFQQSIGIVEVLCEVSTNE
jgi:hypothetical protein